VLSNGRRAANGFQALAEYDANRDGLIDSSDSIFSELRVWKDIDSDAHVDAGELNTLADVGLKAINLNYLNANIVDANGTMHKQIGTL
jgi:exo-beta-1,3-glucanase (GH17 family)